MWPAFWDPGHGRTNLSSKEQFLNKIWWWWCSVTKLYPTLCNLMDCSTPGFPDLHQLLEPAQTHVYWVGNTIQPAHPLSSPFSLPSVFPSIRVFSKESVLCIRWPKYWSFSFSPSNEYSVLISSRIDWFDLLAVQWTQESSPTPQFKSINSSVLSFLYGPVLTSIHGILE